MLRVLALSTRYPDRARPNFGIFVERQMVELAARPGVEVQVIAPIGQRPFSASPAGLPGEEMRCGLCVHRPRFLILPPLPGLRPWALARRLLPLARRLRARFPFDVLSAEFFWPEGPAAVAVGRALGLPVSVKARGMEFERRLQRPGLRRQLIAAGEAAAGLLAVSEDVRATMAAAGLPAERVAIHYPAVDLDRFRPADRAAAKAALRVVGPLLLSVGNLTREKQPWLAVEALSHLEGATLILVGSGPEETRLRRRVEELGLRDRVRMAGSLPNALLPAFYAAADVTLHCPAIEGFGNVRLESLACGTPLVTTAPGEARRLVRSPAAGRIVAPEPAAIAAAVREILADPPAAAAVRLAAEEFSWARSTAQLEAYFRALAGRDA
jgi:glycosyltransferase involved in cell wall biosynthesis